MFVFWSGLNGWGFSLVYFHWVGHLSNVGLLQAQLVLCFSSLKGSKAESALMERQKLGWNLRPCGWEEGGGDKRFCQMCKLCPIQTKVDFGTKNDICRVKNFLQHLLVVVHCSSFIQIDFTFTTHCGIGVNLNANITHWSWRMWENCSSRWEKLHLNHKHTWKQIMTEVILRIQINILTNYRLRLI